MLFVLCYPRLSAEVSDRIEALRRVHEPERAAMVRAHITLVFGVRHISDRALVQRTAEVARSSAPFDLTFTSALTRRDPLHPGLKVYLLVEDGRTPLIRLHRLLYTGAIKSEFRAEIPFDPHMTVATAASDEGIRDAQAEAATLPFPVGGHVESLSVARLQNGRLTSLAEIPLRSAVNGPGSEI